MINFTNDQHQWGLRVQTVSERRHFSDKNIARYIILRYAELGLSAVTVLFVDFCPVYNVFFSQNAAKCVRRPGSVWTRYRKLKLVAGLMGRNMEGEGKGRKGRDWNGRIGRREGCERRREGNARWKDEPHCEVVLTLMSVMSIFGHKCCY